MHNALYDWDYARQLLHLRGGSEEPLYSERFLLRRPLLEALESEEPDGPADRRDRPRRRRVRGLPAGAPVGVPGHDPRAGDGAASTRPTGGHHLQPHARAARRAQAALPLPLDRLPRRRSASAAIVEARLPGVPDEVAGRVCAAVARLRGEDLYKLPGVGETIAWAQALLALDGRRAGGDARRRAQGARGHRARARAGGAPVVSRPSPHAARSACSPPPCARAAPGVGARRAAGRPPRAAGGGPRGPPRGARRSARRAVLSPRGPGRCSTPPSPS